MKKMVSALAAAAAMGCAMSAGADDLPWKMEGSVSRDAASQCKSEMLANLCACETSRGVSQTLLDLVRNEWSSAVSAARRISTKMGFTIIIK